ncbi:MAG: hypothetical protein ACYTGH_05745 [Planctomycetota bacterium]|jgi:hypothetical protein
MSDTDKGIDTMGKFPVISLVIAIVAFVAAAQLSRNMNAMRAEMYKDKPLRLSRTYMPVLGMDKFCADISWVKLIQDMGDPNVKMKYDEKGKTAAQFFYKQLDRITTLDPDANKVYRIGARHISHLAPTEAIALLKKGNDLSTKADWKRYHLSSFIEDRYVRAKMEDKKSEAFTKSLDASIGYLAKAMESSEVPIYIETAFLRKQAEKGGYKDDPLLFLKAEADYYFARSKEISGATSIEQAPKGKKGEPAAEEMDYSMVEDSRLLKTKERILNKARVQALNHWQLAQAGDAAAKAKHMKIHKDISAIFKKVAPELKNYSSVSLNSYGPGEFYDVASGTKVVPYGLSYKAYMENKGIILFKGAYCHVTGQSRTESDKLWVEWAKQNK